MDETIKVKFGGIECHISSYNYMLFYEPGVLEYGSSILTPHQYMSLLFNNLGYDKCPRDFLWMENGIDIYEVPKTEVLDYPITKRNLMIADGISLFSLFKVIKSWIRGGLERGHAINPDRSFLIPNKKLIRYYMENRIKITKGVTISSHASIWDRCDVLARRLYNLVPTIDPDYFEFSITNIERALSDVILDKRTACSIFASAMVDPDIMFSMLEQSEKEAVHLFWNGCDKRTPLALLNEKESIRLFKEIVKQRAYFIEQIYSHVGSTGFLVNGKNRYTVNDDYKLPPMESEIRLYLPVLYRETGELMDETDFRVINEVYRQIASTPLDDDHIKFITSYVEEYSLNFLDLLGEFSMERIAAYKRLYYTLSQIKTSIPEIMSPKDKFILSENFYIDPDRFALYKKSRNKFYVAGLDLIIREMTAQEILHYYDVYLGKHVLHNPDDIGDELESDPAPNINIHHLYCIKLGISMYPAIDYALDPIGYTNMISQRNLDNDMVSNLGAGAVSMEGEESYRLNINSLVMGE